MIGVEFMVVPGLSVIGAIGAVSVTAGIAALVAIYFKPNKKRKGR